MNVEKIRNLAKQMVRLIEDGNFKEAAAIPTGTIPDYEIERAIKEYAVDAGAELSPTPDAIFNEMEVYVRDDEEGKTALMDIDLWFDNSRSDLTLSVIGKETPDGDVYIVVDNLHVM